MLLTYTLAFSLVTLVTEASVASDCMRFLVDDEFHVPCASVSSTSKQPCLVSTAEDHDYLQRYGIVSSPARSIGDMICAPKDDGNDVDCVSTKLRSSKNIDWMWTDWASSPGSLRSRTMYYTNNGIVKHCPYKETQNFTLVLLYTLDDSGEAYADGALVDTTEGYSQERTVELNSATRLLGFKVVNDVAGLNGVRAWVSTGIITDTSSAWRCSLVYEEGWNQVGFDDSHWHGVDVQYHKGGHVGHGAVIIGCGSSGIGPFYFRRMLTA